MSKANFHDPAVGSAGFTAAEAVTDPASTAARAADAWHKRTSQHYLARENAATVRSARHGMLIDPQRHALTVLEAFAQQRQGDLTAARAGARRAAVLAPRHAGSWRLLSAVAYVLGRHPEAREAARRALVLDPADVAAARNSFVGEREAGRWDRAIVAGRRTCVLDPASHANAFDLGMLLLSLGRWSEGWPLYDRRLGMPRRRLGPNRLPQPQWDGRVDRSLTLAVWCDENVGDEMQFAQLLPEVVSRVGAVLLECDPRLVPLFARSFPGIRVVARADRPDPVLLAPEVGAQIPQGHLGGLLRPDPAAFRHGPASWLAADPGRTAALRARYRAWSGGRPVVAVAWKSVNVAFKGKNLPLSAWGPVLGNRGALFLCAQYGDVAGDLEVARAATGVAVVRDPEVDPLADLDGFAAQLAAVDLVISISNSTIHQACGLGRPVWGVLHIRPDWRWGVEGAGCPWFPSLRLYRQTVRGDWDPVLGRIGEDLRRWLADPARAC